MELATMVNSLNEPNKHLIGEMASKLLTLQGQPSEQVNLGEKVNDWIHSLINGGKSPNTIRVYAPAVTKLLAAFPQPTRVTIDAYMATRRATKPQTRAKQIHGFKSFFNYLEEAMGLTNPTRYIKAPKIPQREREIPLPNDVAKFLHVSTSLRDRVFALLLVGCGLRSDEALSLKLSDINLSGLQLTVIGKGNKQRTLPMPHSLIKTLKKYLSTLPSDMRFLFPGRHPDRHLDRSHLNERFRILSKKAGIRPITPHHLRHLFASVLFDRGVNLKIISEALGHSTPSVTVNTYCHLLNKNAMQKAIQKHDPLRGML